MSDNGEQWCRTTSGDTTETAFTWTIEDLESRPQKTGDDPIYSSKFLVKNPQRKESFGQMMLHPKGERKETKDYLSLYLNINSSLSLRVKFKLSIVDSKSKKTRTGGATKLFDNKNPTWGQDEWELRSTIINNPDLLPEGHLTIFCVVAVYGPEETFSGTKDLEIKSRPKDRGLEQVIEQLGKLFDDQEFSDVKIECDGEIFNCHQLILSIRSEVFRAMFQADMVEKRTKKVTIKDMDSDVVREMLHFIYTGVTNEDVLKEKSRELLNLAEMYQLEVLRNICEDKLCSTLEISNSIKYLVLGDIQQADKLRRMALKMIARNMTTLVATEEYQVLVKNLPTLVAEIPAAMIEVMTLK
mgnify:CR=1 FL=1